MISYSPFLFDNFIENDDTPILDLSINRSTESTYEDYDGYSTSNILNKIRNKLKGIMADDR